MSDTVLLFTGIGVFSLMLVAIVFTVLEFRDLSRRDRHGGTADKAETAGRDR